MRLALISLLFIVGCVHEGYRCNSCLQRERELKELECNGCKKLYPPDPWMVNVHFKDFLGKERQFSIETVGNSPTAIYEIRGVHQDGKCEYFYSIKAPEKKSTGLLVFNEVNGAYHAVDFTSTLIKLIPAKPVPLDEISKSRLEYHRKYIVAKSTCPVHQDHYYNELKFREKLLAAPQ